MPNGDCHNKTQKLVSDKCNDALATMKRDFVIQCNELKENPPTVSQMNDKRTSVEAGTVYMAKKRGFVVILARQYAGELFVGTDKTNMRKRGRKPFQNDWESRAVPVYQNEFYELRGSFHSAINHSYFVEWSN